MTPPATSPGIGLVARTEERRVAASAALDPTSRVTLGQYFTPAQVATLVASVPRLPDDGVLRVLDAGAGIGSLTAALVARVLAERPGVEVRLTAVEVDPSLLTGLRATLEDCRETAELAGARFGSTVVTADFTAWAGDRAAGTLLDADRPAFDLAVLNPPYRKIPTGAPEQRALARVGVHVTNLYVAFLAGAVALLDDGGQVAAITPRSFANGPYFRDFRRFLLERVAIDRLHVYESRSTAFADAAVLQENLVFGVTRAPADPGAQVAITTSPGPEGPFTAHRVRHDAVVWPDDPQRFVRVPVHDADTRTAERMAALPATIADLQVEVSTGRVVDFRAREHLRQDPGPGTVPLLYPGHLADGGVRWPLAGSREPNALADLPATARLLLPAGTYVLVKRFSAKEERRRVSAAVLTPDALRGATAVGIENHLNVFHRDGAGLPPDLARGLALWLNGTLVDQYVRQFNGHTQVNATDLRNLRYPSLPELCALGETLGDGGWPEQDKIDALVEQHVLTRRATEA